MVVYKPSFADAEFREDLTENLVIGDCAGDGADVVNDLPDILAQQIGR